MSLRWLDKRVLVTVGTGGVGKTTVAAALGLEAARLGKRVLVLTIDPARRLADALGIGELGHEPRRVPPELISGDAIDGGGELHAMMLDTKRTFDELVARFAPDDESRERIFENPIYRNLTDALSGTREYSAMEKLYELAGNDDYDLVVLDTPPASHALDFLDAPRRLTGFLDGQFIKLLVHPAAAVGRVGFRLFRATSELALKAMERVTGLEFLTSISEFLLAFETLLEGFMGRAHEVEQMLRDPNCGFLMIAGPDPEQVRRAHSFWERLDGEGIHLIGLVVNRVRRWPGEAPPPSDESAQADAVRWLTRALSKRQPEFDPAKVAQVLIATAARQADLARRDAEMQAQLQKALPLDPSQVATIPLFSEDVHALEALANMCVCLFERADG